MFGFGCGCLLIKIVGLVMMFDCWMLLCLVIAFGLGVLGCVLGLHWILIL